MFILVSDAISASWCLCLSKQNRILFLVSQKKTIMTSTETKKKFFLRKITNPSKLWCYIFANENSWFKIMLRWKINNKRKLRSKKNVSLNASSSLPSKLQMYSIIIECVFGVEILPLQSPFRIYSNTRSLESKQFK